MPVVEGGRRNLYLVLVRTGFRLYVLILSTPYGMYRYIYLRRDRPFSFSLFTNKKADGLHLHGHWSYSRSILLHLVCVGVDVDECMCVDVISCFSRFSPSLLRHELDPTYSSLSVLFLFARIVYVGRAGLSYSISVAAYYRRFLLFLSLSLSHTHSFSLSRLLLLTFSTFFSMCACTYVP